MWKDVIIDGYWAQGKVYDEPSIHGINNGRVSKLCICAGSKFDHRAEVYAYDRGLGFDRAPDGLVDKVIERLCHP